MNVPNPVIEIITADNIDFSKKTVPQAPPKVKVEEEKENPPAAVHKEMSNQAEMVKELFDGKYIE